MKNTTLLLSLVLALSQRSYVDQDFESRRTPGLGSKEVAAGWISLFDGESLFGWRTEARADWQAKDGEITVSTGEVGLLRTAVQFDDFELKLEFQTDTATNSGVFIRSSPKPLDPSDDCIEINIAPDSNPFPTGSIVAHRKAPEVSRKAGWNRMRIRANDDRIVVEVNGKTTVDYQNKKLVRKGYVGLQHNSGAAKFRNITIRPLALDSLFNGNSLAGWNEVQKLESRFTVEKPGVLRMESGKGQLESKKRFSDFVFFSHVRTNAVGLNSGVFFRCIPGEVMNGYESQIQNQFKGGDRTKPADFGSGGIFRRQAARFVNSSDKHWFAKTIIADGATFCVWVNGYQVVDWTDNRKADLNPRKGLRLKEGTIILQGHDPTTDLSFKEMRAREMRSRRK